MRFLSALLAPRAKPAPASRPNPPATAPGGAIGWEDTRSYLDSVLTQIAAANEELAHSRIGADPAFADTEPAAMDAAAGSAPQRRGAPCVQGRPGLEGLDVSEVEDAAALLRLFERT